jgi:OOP family OmpA-OmpF porin
MKLGYVFVSVGCLALPLAAQAQPVQGPYVSLGAGTSIENPVPYHFSSNNAGGKWFFTPDYAANAALGYGFGDGWRVQIDGDFIRNTGKKFDRNEGAQGLISGGEQKYGPMFNLLYDIKIGLPFFPYIGAGAGYQWVELDPAMVNGAGQRTSGTKGSFAYDVIAGLSYPVPMVPGLSLTAEYRFMQLTENRKYDYYSPSSPVSTTHILGQESDHSFLLGLRYQLFTPPPAAPALAAARAPVAAPAPVPAKTYLVFFDWDKATLTPRAVQIIASAATDSHTAPTTTIEVSGYTDTSGTAAYNLDLSKRRAAAVAAQLVADGIPAAEIETQAFGETHLLVPTGPGIREPQNRRVEIILQ